MIDTNTSTANYRNTSTRDDLREDCELSMRYHQARADFLERWHLRIQFLVFATTTTGVMAIAEDLVNLSSWLVIAILVWVNVLLLVSLVWNPARKAADHRALYESFCSIAGDVESHVKPNDALCARWNEKLFILYGKEPPPYRALVAHCDNHVAIRRDKVENDYVDMCWFKKMFRNCYRFENSDFLSRKQEREEKERKAKEKANKK